VEDYSAEALKKIGQVLYELGGGTIEELQQRLLYKVGGLTLAFQ
jgi:hypothetical protein